MVYVQSVCDAASAAQPNQDLAIALSALFSVYLLVAIALSGLAVFSASHPIPTAASNAAANGSAVNRKLFVTTV